MEVGGFDACDVCNEGQCWAFVGLLSTYILEGQLESMDAAR